MADMLLVHDCRLDVADFLARASLKVPSRALGLVV